jgi:hypothetical protein
VKSINNNGKPPYYIDVGEDRWFLEQGKIASTSSKELVLGERKYDDNAKKCHVSR